MANMISSMSSCSTLCCSIIRPLSVSNSSCIIANSSS
jgi:hypothetical protein